MNTKLILGFILGLAFFVVVGILFPSLLTSTFNFFAKTRLFDVSVDPVGSKKDSFLISFKPNQSIHVNSFIIIKHCDDAHVTSEGQEEFNSEEIDPLLLSKLRKFIDRNRISGIQKVQINADILVNSSFKHGVYFDQKILSKRSASRKPSPSYHPPMEEKVRFPNPNWHESFDDTSHHTSQSDGPGRSTERLLKEQIAKSDRIPANPNLHNLPPTWYYYEIFVIYNGTNLRSLRFFGRPER